ncbi:MAG: hypothetical protein WCC87_00905 [Candidatus Korobacteraceae bacterium]
MERTLLDWVAREGFSLYGVGLRYGPATLLAMLQSFQLDRRSVTYEVQSYFSSEVQRSKRYFAHPPMMANSMRSWGAILLEMSLPEH